MTTDIVALSGGIDSTALALLMEDAELIFTDTGWEFDEIYNHLDRIEAQTGRTVRRLRHPQYPKGLPEYIAAAKFLPNHGARFCTRMFKIEVMNYWLPRLGLIPATMCVGLRADEPADERVGNLTEMEGLAIRYPLREQGMTRTDCIALCLEHDLLPRYPVYMARGGCKGCFYKRKSEVIAMQTLVPHVLDELQELEEGVQDERGRYFHMFPNVGKSIADLRAQPALFNMTEVYKAAAEDFDKGQACGLFCHR
jgi:hypothetical protein